MTGNHRLPVGTGQWDGIPLMSGNVKFALHEYHYLFTCDCFKSVRKSYLKPYFYVKPNIRKNREIFTSTNEATLIKSKLVAIIIEKFSV